MLVEETWCGTDNKREWWTTGSSGFYEPYTDDIGRLFKEFQREYGKCVSSLYVETRTAGDIRCGWVFEKRRKYEDCNQTYIAQTWVALYDDTKPLPDGRVYHNPHSLD
jgi:hypothetical protein